MKKRIGLRELLETALNEEEKAPEGEPYSLRSRLGHELEHLSNRDLHDIRLLLEQAMQAEETGEGSEIWGTGDRQQFSPYGPILDLLSEYLLRTLPKSAPLWYWNEVSKQIESQLEDSDSFGLEVVSEIFHEGLNIQLHPWRVPTLHQKGWVDHPTQHALSNTRH